MLQTFSKVWILIDFKINQETIAKELCVQREKPNNCCQGKCYLKTQIEQNEKGEQKQIPQSLKEKLEVIYYTPQLPFVLTKYIQELQKVVIYIYDACLYAFAFASNVFQPPEFPLI